MTADQLPRFMIAGTRSGVGKSVLFACLLRLLLHKKEEQPAAFKCGPDYLDPLFHKSVSGIETGNLDSYFYDKETLRHILLTDSKESTIACIEGVMGFYDGVATEVRGSSAEIAAWTDTPVILVADGSGRSVSTLAEIEGFLHYHPYGANIKGVILNRLSAGLYPPLKKKIEMLGVKPLGYLPRMEQLDAPSRYLGLITPQQKDEILANTDDAAERMKEWIDIDGLLQLANEAPAIGGEECYKETVKESGYQTTIAIARDAAFSFWYRENELALQNAGAKLLYFDPISDDVLPKCDGLILPGGYPELYAKELSGNTSMRTSIYDAITDGMPTIAECGGFLYLHQTLETKDKSAYPMVGVIKGECFYQGRSKRFGYAKLQADEAWLLAEAGEAIKAHEFHYYESTMPGDMLCAVKPGSDRSYRAGHIGPSLYAGFLHLPLYAMPRAVDRFVRRAREYGEERYAHLH